MRVFIAILILVFPQQIFATLRIPKIMGHNMVLQREQVVPLWGWASPGEKITVSFNNQRKGTIADADGNWKLSLGPLKASFKPAELFIKGEKEDIVLKNILVGEVWFCSGQSNMEFAMRKFEKLQPPVGSNWPVTEVTDAKNDQLRIFLSERKKMQPDSTHQGWTAAIGTPLRSFSAVAYFFAKELQSKLKVPVGVISAAIPGSRIEPWMPAEAMLAEPFFKENIKDSARRIDGDPGKFYTSMVEPLIPFAIKGILWYQGESNCFLNERLQYSYKMKSLINYWRSKWQLGSLPFYYVQIAPYFYSKATDRPYTVYSEPEFWEAQLAVLKIPNTAMIATTDLNDDPADLHPVNKWDVGKRLANAAFSKTYKAGAGVPMGPIYKSSKKQGNKFIIEFDYIGDGLVIDSGDTLQGFEVENAAGIFVPAIAEIKANKVLVYSKEASSPKSVRYGWREDALPTLYNKNGLPAISFRTNNPLTNKFH